VHILQGEGKARGRKCAAPWRAWLVVLVGLTQVKPEFIASRAECGVRIGQ
jgi:hypothetical protein